MKKLTLNLDALTLDSFQPQAHPAAAGPAQPFMGVPNTQQVKCTYFCTYDCPTGFSC